MPGLSKTEPERMVQRQFRKSWLIAGTILALSILLFRAGLNRLPNRVEQGEKTVPLTFQPVSLGPSSEGVFRLVGAWRLLAEDQRFGGISALAIDGGDLVALSDSGVVARFRKPGSGPSLVTLDELPGGPGRAGFKVNRDSEALAAVAGSAWAVAFENRDEIWIYDRSFTRALKRARIRRAALSRNRGIEGMVARPNGLLLFPENGGRAVDTSSGQSVPLRGISGWISDAVRLPDGRLLIANRRPTPIGLHNALIFLERTPDGYRAAGEWIVPVGRLDNVEALAAEQEPNGLTRLWLMTDNNLQQRRPTLLLALDLRRQPWFR